MMNTPLRTFPPLPQTPYSSPSFPPAESPADSPCPATPHRGLCLPPVLHPKTQRHEKVSVTSTLPNHHPTSALPPSPSSPTSFDTTPYEKGTQLGAGRLPDLLMQSNEYLVSMEDGPQEPLTIAQDSGSYRAWFPPFELCPATSPDRKTLPPAPQLILPFYDPATDLSLIRADAVSNPDPFLLGGSQVAADHAYSNPLNIRNPTVPFANFQHGHLLAQFSPFPSSLLFAPPFVQFTEGTAPLFRSAPFPITFETNTPSDRSETPFSVGTSSSSAAEDNNACRDVDGGGIGPVRSTKIGKRQAPIAKNLQCPDCHLCFARQHDLTRHRRIHSGEQPYECIACSQRFRRSDARQRHWRGRPECKLMHDISSFGSEGWVAKNTGKKSELSLSADAAAGPATAPVQQARQLFPQAMLFDNPHAFHGITAESKPYQPTILEATAVPTFTNLLGAPSTTLPMVQALGRRGSVAHLRVQPHTPNQL